MGEKRNREGKEVTEEDFGLTLELQRLEKGMEYFSAYPLADVYEIDDFIIIELEVPGLSKEDLVIEATNNYIYVSGIKVQKTSSEKTKFYCLGRTYGAFKRTFEVPIPFNLDGVRAKLENGVLTIKLPKVVDKRKKKVKIKIE